VKVTRLKNIVILALIIVNALFLVFFIGRLVKEHSDKKEALMNLSALFERNGIHIDTGNIREGGTLSGLLVSRNTQKEQLLAEKLLGQTEVTENGGIYTYTGKDGQAVFRSGGTFEITFSSRVYGGISSVRSTAKSLLQTMGIETVSLSVAGEQENETVDALCSWERQPIFNCRILFVFKDGGLSKISGRYAANISVTDGRTDMSSCATSMMYFLDEVRNGRISCSQIFRIEPGYKLKASGDLISPVWRVVTDTEVSDTGVSNTGVSDTGVFDTGVFDTGVSDAGVSYYIDPITGNIEPDTQ
jgi:hypothetical protein